MKSRGVIAFLSSLRNKYSLKIRPSIFQMRTTASINANLLSQHLNRLKSSPSQSLLLDGGTGEELFLRGVPDDRKIWSATAIVHEKYHSTVEKVHRSFIEAGSQAITTNSYGIIPGVGFTDGEEVKKLMGVAGKIARQAVTDESGTASALVLGSLGPLVESYRADLIMKHDDGVRYYQYGIEGLNPYVDVYLAETMSCTEEACQVIDALSAFYNKGDDESGTNLHEKKQRPLLVSFTLGSDGKLRSGESVLDAIPKMISFALDREVQLIGVLFNCCEPEAITKALNEIVSKPDIYQYLHHPPHANRSSSQSSEAHNSKIFLGAYANKLAPVDPNWTMATSTEAQPMRHDLPPDSYWKFVKCWHDGDGIDGSEIGGMQLIGGCCGIGPDHISCLREHLLLLGEKS